MNFFKKIFQWIGGILGLVKKYLTPAVLAVEALKLMMNNPMIDLITALTKTTKDDAVIAKIRELLPQVLIKLNLATEYAGKSDKEIIAEALKLLAQKDGSTKANLFNAIAALLGELISNGKLETKYAIAGTPRIYREVVKGETI